MRREPLIARENWREKVEKLGLLFHRKPNGEDYWDESACYLFDKAEIELLESATNELHRLCLTAVDHIVKNRLYHRFFIREEIALLIERSWRESEPSLYGRFDLAYSGDGPPKLLEYNGDTPTSLLETAVIQWHWLQDINPDADQFNSIWEELVERWRQLKISGKLGWGQIHFASSDSLEDFMTIMLLQDTAEEASLKTYSLLMEEIGWNSETNRFVDFHDHPITALFKLYPWEWLLDEQFGKHVLNDYGTHIWIEPIWKMLLSTKALLPILWELYPDHPNLLPAYLGNPRELKKFVKKPLLGREGWDTTIHDGSESSILNSSGRQRYVYQQFAPLAHNAGKYAVVGSWIVGNEACGIGIRESETQVTTNLSSFVPHYFLNELKSQSDPSPLISQNSSP